MTASPDVDELRAAATFVLWLSAPGAPTLTALVGLPLAFPDSLPCPPELALPPALPVRVPPAPARPAISRRLPYPLSRSLRLILLSLPLAPPSVSPLSKPIPLPLTLLSPYPV
ncbi:hypothetical protein CF645_37395 [Burkholderia pseudomallei]|nr:hypothetical protein CF645_37395 [Burkholderia pseudomallei]